LAPPFVKQANTRDEIPTRALERALVQQLLEIWQTEAQRAVKLLRQSEGRTLPIEFWSEYARTQERVLAPWLLEVARAGVEAVAGDTSKLQKQEAVSVVWDLVNLDAAAWAEEYGYELVGGITATTQGRMQRAMRAWVEAGETFPELVERVNVIFDNRKRAEMIAATEATRAFVEGNLRAWQAEGIPPAAVQPPAHPHCRCNVRPKLFADGTWAVIWYTARDELTRRCVARIETPWGVFIGCAAMHKRVVSEGPYGGMLLDEAEAQIAQAAG